MKKLIRIVISISLVTIFLASCGAKDNVDMNSTPIKTEQSDLGNNKNSENNIDEKIFSETEDDVQRELTKEEKNFLYGEWALKEFLGFTAVNDNESEFQNYPNGISVLNSNILFNEDLIQYNINIENEEKIPDKYKHELEYSFKPSGIVVTRTMSVSDFMQSKGTMGAFEVDEQYMPTNNVKEVEFINDNGYNVSIDIYDDTRVVWYMFGCVFELEKIN